MLNKIRGSLLDKQWDQVWFDLINLLRLWHVLTLFRCTVDAASLQSLLMNVNDLLT
jgi:hypothetical protein